MIPLRGGSKGVPRKNLRLLNNKPLFSYICKAALESNFDTYVSTEDKEIKNEVIRFSREINIIDRPSVFAEDNSSTEDVISHFIECQETVQHIILLQATSPFTNSADILESYAYYESNNSAQTLLSVTTKHEFIWDSDGGPCNYSPDKRPRRQDWDGHYVENGALYIFSTDSFMASKSRLTPPCLLYKMPPERSFEIDSEYDLALAQTILSLTHNGN